MVNYCISLIYTVLIHQLLEVLTSTQLKRNQKQVLMIWLLIDAHQKQLILKQRNITVQKVVHIHGKTHNTRVM